MKRSDHTKKMLGPTRGLARHAARYRPRMRRNRCHLAATLLAVTAATACLSTWDLGVPGGRPTQAATGQEHGSRSIAVRWNHPDPSTVEHFRIYWGLEEKTYLTYQDVGKPVRSGNIFEAELLVPAGLTVHVALTAIGPAGESPKSNLGVCAPDCTRARPLHMPPGSTGRR